MLTVKLMVPVVLTKPVTMAKLIKTPVQKSALAIGREIHPNASQDPQTAPQLLLMPLLLQIYVI